MHFIALVLLGIAIVAAPAAKADEWNKKTVVTFSAPVEIPGKVLPAGTYVFKLADSQSDRHIVQIYNKDEDHLYATILAVPDYRLEPTGKTVITFEERASASPEALKAWFYPGDNFGHEFVYPKAKAMELAKRTKQNVPSMADNSSSMKTAALGMEKGSEEKVQTVQAVKPQPPAPSAAPAPAPAPAPVTEQAQTTETARYSAADRPQQLPHTASPLPLIGLIGLLSLAGGLSVRALDRSLR
ncbi:MAG TPA: hypothetical protein VL285_18580 [Bryobacteraceae bacterium]|nr:hypothetical protein [Bryobacteraceae bacterium]